MRTPTVASGGRFANAVGASSRTHAKPASLVARAPRRCTRCADGSVSPRRDMEYTTALLFDLFVIYLAAKLAAELFERIRQPPVIGELLAGVLIGPYALGLIGSPDPGLVEAFHGDAEAATEAVSLVYHLVAELGVVVLLFFVGL